MAKLQFKYATMNSGKTLDLIRRAYSYEENGFKILVIKPKIDSKGDNKITSRIGLERKVDFLIDKDESILEVLKYNLDNVKCIFADEAQFFNSLEIDELNIITKAYDIPVIAYGLRVNFKNELFEGSKRLLEVSDEFISLHSLCECGDTANFVGRKVNNEYRTDGEEVLIDGSNDNVIYKPLCGKCYMKKVLKLDLNKIKEI